MPLQIIILNTNSQSDGSFSVSGVFWLNSPPNNIIPVPDFQSQVPFIDPSNLLSLRYGNIVEQSFNSGLFESQTSSSEVQSSLQIQYDEAQVLLNNTNSPVSGLIGSVFDGQSWKSSNPFTYNDATSLASQYTQRHYSWTDWKKNQLIKSGSPQFDDNGTVYKIWFYDGPEVNVCNIWKSTVPDSVIRGGYSQSQNDTDKTNFETKYKANFNKPIDMKLSDGRLRMAVEKTQASKVTFYSHDWGDPTTWYTSSILLTNEVAVADGYFTSYSVAHKNIIDTYHGKITNEDFIKDAAGLSYRVKVYVDGYVKAEQDPHYAAGGNFTVDYNDGKIIFLTPLTADNVVTVTYHYATNSTFIVKPTPGTNLKIEFAEVQFSGDVIITDSIVFQPYGYVDYFAPQYCTTNGGPYPPGTKIPLGNPLVYKSISDYQNDAVRSYSTYPAIGGDGWRGCSQKIIILDWDYLASTVLQSSVGLELRIKLQHDTPFGGYYSTATFYGVSET